jgi:ketosteroid isomerase-like protein
MINQQLLERYYRGFAKKAGWEDTLAEDFKFIGGDMMNQEPIIGKSAYVGIIARFSQLFTDMRVKEMFVHEQSAFVLANYDYVFPKGVKINANVAEYWTIKEGKLDSLTIFFDTASFSMLTRRD